MVRIHVEELRENGVPLPFLKVSPERCSTSERQTEWPSLELCAAWVSYLLGHRYLHKILSPVPRQCFSLTLWWASCASAFIRTPPQTCHTMCKPTPYSFLEECSEDEHYPSIGAKPPSMWIWWSPMQVPTLEVYWWKLDVSWRPSAKRMGKKKDKQWNVKLKR